MIMNPMNSNSGTDVNTPSMPQNDVSPNKFRNFNTFPMSYEHLLTARYGDITPFFVYDAWAEDKVPFASFHELRNYTLSSPLLNKIKMMKDYYLVPMRAILPRTWEFYITNPNQGEDIPDDACPYISTITPLFYALSSFDNVNYHTNFGSTYQAFHAFLKYVVVTENVFSDGGIFSLLGCKLSKYFKYNNIYSIDTFYSDTYKRLFDIIRDYDISLTIPSTNKTYYLLDFENDYTIYSDPNRIPWHRYLELIRTNSDFILNLENSDVSSNELEEIMTSVDLLSILTAYVQGLPVNISRVAAYQIICHHFFSNDKVDSIYSADLYRSLLETDYLSYNPVATFEMNGVTHLYDVFSNKYLSWAFSATTSASRNFQKEVESKLHYLYHLTTINKSMKFGDYYTGARTRPLAVGDVNAPVINNAVSAIDMTRNIATQRFLNAVNKTGRKLSEYSKKIIGGYVQPISTDPKFLAHDELSIGREEIENTAEDTGLVKTNLRSEQSKYVFECEVSEPSIIIGVVSFEVKRFYSRSIDRHFLKKDRFDLFNSYFQNIGDQEVFRAEKGLGSALTPFAYQLRHMEYKQRVSIASGGAVEHLKSWSMIADNDFGTEVSDTELTSEFIRSSNADFDRFYSSLTGNTLCDYFHFIINFDNQTTPLRNMEYSPTIL